MYKINKYKKLIENQEKKISDLEEIIASLKSSMVTEIRKIPIPYSSNMLYKAWNGEDDMRSFMWGDLLKELFQEKERENVSFKEIIVFGREGAAYEFRFTFKGVMFGLSIPNVARATVENYIHIRYGMYSLSYEKSLSYWKVITESYDLEDISRAILDFVKE